MKKIYFIFTFMLIILTTVVYANSSKLNLEGDTKVKVRI